MNISTVVVTYNRLSLLKRALHAIETQTLPPASIIVVDNCSTDGTKEFLAEWMTKQTGYQKQVVPLPRNMGGSGGFYHGLEAAMAIDPDWVWLADDDAFPGPDAFALFAAHQAAYAAQCAGTAKPLGVVCSTVLNDGKIDEIHRRRTHHKHGFTLRARSVGQQEYAKGIFPIDLFTYVGVFIKREVLAKVGLTEKDYFIWYDDSEHAMRIAQHYSILCDAKVSIHHNVPAVPNQISWKTFYGERNRLLMFKKHHYPTYLYRLFKIWMYLLSVKPSSSPAMKKLKWRAMWAAIRNQQGVHEAYLPGAKIV